MDIAFHLSWWMIPTAIFVGGMFWALVLVKGEGLFGTFDNLFAMLPVLLISVLAFAIAGALK